MIDKIKLILASIFVLFLITIIPLYLDKYKFISGEYYIILFFYIIIMSWSGIESLKEKHGKIYIDSLILLFSFQIVVISIVVFIIHYFKIEWPERGGSIYAMVIGVPLFMLLFLIFDILDDKLAKRKRKNNINEP